MSSFRGVFVALVLSASLHPAQALTASGRIGFNVKCEYSHSLPDDPIVFPGQPGASHLHDFYGNTTTDAFTTSTVGGPTTCAASGDSSGYWQPALLVNGTAVQPDAAVIYYQPGVSDATLVRPFPPGLRMIAGDSHAIGPQANVFYRCEGSGAGDTPMTALPQDCRPYPGSHLTAHIKFPSCWDGLQLDSTDHKSHMAFVSRGGCPANYNHPVPEVGLVVHWSVEDGSTATLSSGLGYSMHADFFNGWSPTTLANLVRKCINPMKRCGSIRG
jgi:hypothetical protein